MPKAGRRERLRYRFDNTMSKGTPALIGLLALASLLLISVVSVLAVIVGEESIGRIFWMSMHRSLDAGTMADDQGSGLFLVLMLTVTVGGIFVVAALIGVLNAGLSTKLEEVRKGRSRVAESGHTVVLGWSDQMFTVVHELVLANESEPRSCVAILADKDKVAMEDELRARVGPTGTTHVVCRTGCPTEPIDLDILRLEAAKSIIVMSPADEEPDVHVIKTLLALSNRSWAEPRPHVFAAVESSQNLAAARLAGGPHATVVDAEDIAARLLVQTCRQGGLSIVCSDLLGFTGEELYLRSEPTLTGRTFGEALYAFETATPIGLYRSDDTAVVNPPVETRIEASDQVVVLAEDDSVIRLAEQQPAIMADAIRVVEPTAVKPERILLLGWNARTVQVIDQLDRYVAPGSEVHVAARAIDSRVDLDALRARMDNVRVSFGECDITDRAALERLHIGSFDDVGVLADDTLSSDHADARTLVTLLHLRDMQSRLGERYSIVSEMNDERNRELAEVTRADDFVVSGKLVSLLLTQLSENRHLARVFDVLFDSSGSEIHLKPAEDYVCPGEAVNFATMVKAASLRNETAIGYRIQSRSFEPPTYGVNLNPDKSESVMIHAGDQLIVLSRGIPSDIVAPRLDHET